MRKLIALLTIFSFNAYAVAPTGVGGEDGALSYTNNLKAPAYTITSLGGVNSRIESGNTNLLMNPSFEHTAVATGYTGSNFTATANTTNQVEGKKAISLAISGGTLGFGQSSSINAANLVGLQGVVSIKIKTSLTDVKVCPMNAGTEVSSLCVNVTSNNSWKHVVIPFILSATSNGFKVKTTSSTSGTVIVDDAFVGTSQPFQDVSGAKLVGTLKYAGTVNCEWQNTNASFGGFSADTDCATPTVTGSIQAPATKIPAFVLPAGSPAGTYYIVAKGMFYVSTGNYSNWRFSDGTYSTDGNVGYNNTQSLGSIVGSFTTSTAFSSNSTFNIQIKNNGGASFITSTPLTDGLSFEVYYFPPATKIYSQASQDYAYTNAGSITIGATTTAPTKGTVVTDRIMASRKGQNLLAKYQFEMSSIGTTGSGDYLFTLPSGLSFDTNIVIPSTAASDGRDAPTQKALVGYGHIGDGTNRGMCYLFAYDSTRFRAACGAVYGSYGFVSSGYYHLGTIRGFEFELNAPISGWSDYGVIVGSFAGLEKCANDYECTDTFSAQISATGVVSNENLDWINGNCSNPSASNYTCTFLTNTLKDGSSALVSPMNCVVTRDQATAAAGYVDPRVTSTTTGLTVQTPSPVSTNVNQPFSIKCQKGSQDYKAKSGKIATTTGVNYVPGAGAGETYDSFSVSYAGSNAGNPASWTNCTTGTCNIDQIGSAVSSIVWSSAGNYTLNLSKTYSKLKCAANATTVGTGYQVVSQIACVSCSSLTFATGSAANTTGTLVCQGKY